MADSSTPVNQPITAPSESTHANQTLQDQIMNSSPQLPPPQNLHHQLSGAAESSEQLIASLPPEPNSALFLAGVPSLASTQSNPSPPKQDPSSMINFGPELPSLSKPPGPGLGCLINECMMILKQRSGSQPAALNVNNQLPYAGSESSILQLLQIACQLLPPECNSPGHFLLEVLQAISQSQQILDNMSPHISMVQELLHPAYNPDRVLPPAAAYGLALNQADSNHERNPPQLTTIDIDGPRLSLPNSSTVNAAPNYQPRPSVSPPVTQYQVSNPMVAPPSFGNLPTVVQSQLQVMKETQQSPVPPPRQSVQPPPQLRGALTPVLRKKNVANKAANLANLLPTGTVLAFQSIVPSLSNTGRCDIFNRYLIGFVIAICAATCFLSSFTDSFEYNEKLYYGFATCNGLCVFNYENRVEEEPNISKELEKYKVEVIDLMHAFGSLFVFLIFAISSSEVLSCFFPQAGENDKYSVVVYLPLVAGVLSSFLFSIFPTKRKGFGTADQGISRP